MQQKLTKEQQNANYHSFSLESLLLHHPFLGRHKALDRDIHTMQTSHLIRQFLFFWLSLTPLYTNIFHEPEIRGNLTAEYSHHQYPFYVHYTFEYVLCIWLC
eukprot:982082_1